MTKEKYRKDITNERLRLSKKLSIPYTTIISRLNNGFYVEYFGGDIE